MVSNTTRHVTGCRLNQVMRVQSALDDGASNIRQTLPAGVHLQNHLEDAGRGLHSSTFRLNVSTFCWIRWVHDFHPVYQTGGHGEV
jgi:hypothetical protein